MDNSSQEKIIVELMKRNIANKEARINVETFGVIVCVVFNIIEKILPCDSEF